MDVDEQAGQASPVQAGQAGAEQPGVGGAAPRSPAAAEPTRRTRGLLVPITLGLAVVLVVAAVLAQLLLPGIAAEDVRGEVSKYGSVSHVEVHASPAIELIWGQAERIDVTAGQLRLAPDQLAQLAGKLGSVEEARTRAGSLELAFASPMQGSVTLTGAELRKRNGTFTVSGQMVPAGVNAVLPMGLTVQGIEAVGGRPAVTVAGSLIGVGVQVQGMVGASEGKIVIEASGLPLVGMAQLVLFEDPHFYVESVGAAPAGSSTSISITSRMRS